MAQDNSTRNRSRSVVAIPITPKPHRLDIHRSRIMRSVRQRITAPEIALANAMRGYGWRLRRNVRALPGSPDLASKSRRIAVFVHGCFWHRHEGCRLSTTPKHNRAFWDSKFAANVARDRRNERALRGLGYSVLVVWECETHDASKLRRKLDRFRRRLLHQNDDAESGHPARFRAGPVPVPK
jgi:DNA mismatch endonuclease (patch repair protein)